MTFNRRRKGDLIWKGDARKRSKKTSENTSEISKIEKLIKQYLLFIHIQTVVYTYIIIIK